MGLRAFPAARFGKDPLPVSMRGSCWRLLISAASFLSSREIRRDAEDAAETHSSFSLQPDQHPRKINVIGKPAFESDVALLASDRSGSASAAPISRPASFPIATIQAGVVAPALRRSGAAAPTLPQPLRESLDALRVCRSGAHRTSVRSVSNRANKARVDSQRVDRADKDGPDAALHGIARPTSERWSTAWRRVRSVERVLQSHLPTGMVSL